MIVEVEAATTCGTDRKMLLHGHRILGRLPGALRARDGRRAHGHGRARAGGRLGGLRACGPCRAGRAAICREPTWVLGGFAERIAAPPAALHAIPDGLDFAGAAMAEPLAACVHAWHAARTRPTSPSWAGARSGSCSRACSCSTGVTSWSATAIPSAGTGGGDGCARGGRARRARPRLRGGRPAGGVGAGRRRGAPGGTVVLVGGCPAGTTVALETGPLHYDEIDVRGAFHHTRAEVDRALALLGAGDVDWRALAGPAVGLEELAGALQAPTVGEARKLVVDPVR